MLSTIKGNQLNIFFNLEEGILDELIEFASKEEEIDGDTKHKEIQEIKEWKKRYLIEINHK